MKWINLAADNRKRGLIGLALSLAIHAILVAILVHQTSIKLTTPGEEGRAPLEVRFIQPASRPAAPAQVAIAPPAPKANSNVTDKRTPRPPTPRKPTAAPPSPKPTPTPPPEQAKPKFDPNLDMTDMLTAARDRRRAQGITDSEPNQNQKQDDSAIARANVQELMEKQSRGRNDSGGVFQITHKGVRNAEFIFRGWSMQRNRNMRQLIQVDAGLGGDVDTAIARRMIEIIRQFERADFTWQSQRLGRTVTLSARLKDTADLEEFLKLEFMN